MPDTNPRLTAALRRALLLPATLPVLLGASAAFAQQNGDLEEIVATGTRIARDPNLAGALPVQSVSSDMIEASGQFSLSDVVNDVPSLLFSVTSEQSIDTAGVANGGNVLNLRGLGLNRTLVLVNGRRHVGGLQGSSAVDIGSIPNQLVERVEVLTGGASAVYGADAVTGVVNFILKDDFEGFEIDGFYGISGEGDGQQYSVAATWGTNFADDRANISISLDYRKDEGLTFGDRPESQAGTGALPPSRGAQFGTGGDWVNPALRFQQGDIGAATTPNFAQFYNFGNTGLTNFGLPIPTDDVDEEGNVVRTAEQVFIDQYTAAFPGDPAPSLTPAELALLDRAATSPQRAVLPEITFPFTSGYGYVIPGNPFTFSGFDPETPIDLNGNGNPDCLDSFTGYNSVFGAASFGVVGGCWVADENGDYSVIEDGLVSGDFQGFGGSSFDVYRQNYFNLLLPDERISLNLLGHVDLTDRATAFFEAKYFNQSIDDPQDPNSFWDLLFGAADNPFLPDFLQDVADQTGGIAITMDPIAFRSVNSTERETIRFVAGVEGELANGWNYTVSANYGRFDQDIRVTNQVINDRFFAAIDAVTDPATGQPACRSSVDPNAAALNTPFQIPAYEEGYFTFTPGDGQCVPLNIWAGTTGFTSAALDFVTVDTRSNLVLDQFVLTGALTGDTGNWFELPGGPIQFAIGAEYRDEQSNATFDDWQRGILPAGSPDGAGTFIGDVSENTSLVFRPQLSVANEIGEYDVSEVFLETSLPLLRDVTLARELTIGAAARFAEYSTIGSALTWNTNLVYAPVESLSFRGTFSQAVRAPNITELFGPEIGATFRPDDPCDAAQIQAIRADNPQLADQLQANCVADFANIGLDPFENGVYSFSDPLSASFGGIVGGNPDLQEETAETFTLGVVFQPSFLDGFSLTVDYWDISIDDAIEAVSSQNTVDGCYQGAALNDNFCSLFTRNDNPASAQYGGFDFLRQTTINFAKVETSGFDFSARYGFMVGDHAVDLSVSGTKVNEIDLFQNPLDLTEVNPELGEIGRPEWAGNVMANYGYRNFGLGWQSQYIGEMLFAGLEIETAETLYGPTVSQDATWIHNINAYYDIGDKVRVRAGINNLTDEVPFITNNAFPASPRGRFFFVGVNAQI
jgi:outer membrane receptor protein involved in Fe transport